MEKWIQEALSNWRSDSIKLNSNATTEEIKKTEGFLNFNFPDDFKELYLIINGFVNYEWQQHMFSFWSLERIMEEYEDSNSNQFIGFCDFLIMSNTIGFKKDENGIFKMYPSVVNNIAEKISNTFSDVVFMINNSSQLIY